MTDTLRWKALASRLTLYLYPDSVNRNEKGKKDQNENTLLAAACW